MRYARGPAKLRVMFGEEIAIGPGKALLLEAIDATGSISESARRLGMSYRRAWLLADTMNRCFREPLIASAAGGPGGGGARLTHAPMALPRILAAIAFASCLALPARAAPLTVFAAASLKGSLDQVAAAFEAKGTHKVRIAYGASSALARQIEAGAPAHLFISADAGWVDYLEERGLTRPPRANLLANELVLIAPAASRLQLRIAPAFALAAALQGGRLAVADPAHVPAGQYARAALGVLGAWPQVAAKLAPAENVRAALALVAREEAPLGIVYRTDALAEPRVRVVDTFPPGTHAPIVYPLALLRGAGDDARAFAAFAASSQAREIWARHGFGIP